VAPKALPGTTELAQQFAAAFGPQVAAQVGLTVTDSDVLAGPSITWTFSCPVAVAIICPVAMQLAPGASVATHVVAESVIVPTSSPVTKNEDTLMVCFVPFVKLSVVSRASF
jgi:hypothetical protein